MLHKVGDKVTHNYIPYDRHGVVVEVVPGRTLYRDTYICPYTVKWEDGVQDIYSEHDLRKVDSYII